MKIVIIETGLPPKQIRANNKSYPEMFQDLLTNPENETEFETFSIIEAPHLPSLDAFDACLITGSPAGVYEDHIWMAPLFQFIRNAASASKPLIGICFGHQAIAQALGGAVTKSPKGWGIGRHTYNIQNKPAWFPDNAKDSFSLAVSHQDQVISPPSGAMTIASSEFCEFAALYYPDACALTFQGHPEFSNQYTADLYNIRRGTKLDADMVDQAIISLEEVKDDNNVVAQWIWAFLNTHQ